MYISKGVEGVGGGGGDIGFSKIEASNNLIPQHPPSPRLAGWGTLPRSFTWAGSPWTPASSLMKIHGFISISGVISEAAKHKTGLFPRRSGEPDRMTQLSALAEQGSCRA